MPKKVGAGGWIFLLESIFILFSVARAEGQVSYTDNFNAPINYLTNGTAGTFWDGIYFGAGEFNNTGVGGGGAGATIQCDANISAANTLTLQTTGTAWEAADDDGLFLYKVVPGDFSMSVHVVSPFNNAGYNTAGLQARAFSAGGDAYGGKENFVSWTRFDEFNFPNYLRSEVNGGVAQINPGDFPNGAYWLRMDRIRGTNFMFYQRSNNVAPWQLVTTFPTGQVTGGTNLRRADMLGLPMQVGIIHATFAGQLGVQFTDFNLIESNVSFATPPAPPTGLNLQTNINGTVTVSWTPGSGSAGSLVAVWNGTNNLVKQIPANGFTYTGDARYGFGSTLPAMGWFVVYAGSGSSVTVTNLFPGTYNFAVFSYAGSASAIAYNHSPARVSVSIPENLVTARADVESGDVMVSFSANPGKWYWVQYTDSLNPPVWQNLQPGPVLSIGTAMNLIHAGGALAPQRYYRVLQMDPLFTYRTGQGFINSLRRTGDAFPTEYIGGGGKLGDAVIKYRPTSGSTWFTSRAATLAGIASSTNYVTPDGTKYVARYTINSGLTGNLIYESVFTYRQDELLWSLNLTNLSGQSVTLGDLALPLPMNTTYSGVTSSTMKHSFISGDNSFIFWMRPDSVGPCLLFTPDDRTKLEYWDRLNGYEVYIHSLVAGSISATNFPAVTTQGNRWRQPNTSLTLAAGGSQSYGFRLQWADDYDAIRQALVDEGKINVHIVPGMTLPTNLFARIALNTTQAVNSVQAEFPGATQIQYLGVTNGTYQMYQVQFSQLGENKVTVQYGSGKNLYLEFFVTEPIETLIKKRASFLVSKQINDASKWYNGLFCDWNMNDQVLITPDNHDTVTGFVVYEIASDDAGESRPAYMGEKEAVFPAQSEVTALDNYIRYFVWNTGQPTGGLQRTTNETFSYAVYGIPDWHNLRTNNSLSIGRGYDYPHIIAMYYGMYRVAKYHPEVTTLLSAQEYLTRAQGTAMAMFSYGGGQATQIGLMNEVVIPDVIDALQAEGMTTQAAVLRSNWEQKVSYYVNGYANLFGSEYAFDSTGFESQQAYAKYAMQHAGTSALMGSANPAGFLQQTRAFMDTQIAANVFDRGWLETAYYHYGSDYRGDMGDDYVLSYMAQMGGWGLLDYALYYATNSTDYLRLGYASILSAWATMNSGTPASNYGFWYPGAANDGGCGGGFEPLPYNTTWLGQPMHRGDWYYSAEENLGFCGAVRGAATILADDPLFGRFCYGGTAQPTSTNIQVTLLDGVRKRFHAMLNSGSGHLIIDSDRFVADRGITLKEDFSLLGLTIETDNPASHTARLHVTVPTGGTYTISSDEGNLGILNMQANQEAVVDLPIPASTITKTFFLAK
jgi:Family of unknown function (DUF5695)